MERKTGKKTKQCSDYQQKLTEMIIEKTSFHEYPLLGKHIDDCVECAAFLKSLTRFEEKIGKDTIKLPNPNQAILRNILRYMEIKRASVWKNESFWDSLSGIMQYKIPIYQAVGGFLVLIFMTGFLLNSYSLSGRNGLTINKELVGNQDVDLSDSLITGTTERGQSAREDSILVGFLQYSL